MQPLQVSNYKQIDFIMRISCVTVDFSVTLRYTAVPATSTLGWSGDMLIASEKHTRSFETAFLCNCVQIYDLLIYCFFVFSYFDHVFSSFIRC